MLYQKELKIKIFLILSFILNIYCSVIQQYIQSDVLNYENLNINDVKVNLNCPGNEYITTRNGCAKENRDKIIIYSNDSKGYCIKKQTSKRIEVTKNYNECNKFKFDYIGHDTFKLFSENSDDHIIDKFGNWEWGKGSIPAVEVWDSNSGDLCITFYETDYVGGVPLGRYLSMGVYDNGQLFSGPKGKFYWYAELI